MYKNSLRVLNHVIQWERIPSRVCLSRDVMIVEICYGATVQLFQLYWRTRGHSCSLIGPLLRSLFPFLFEARVSSTCPMNFSLWICRRRVPVIQMEVSISVGFATLDTYFVSCPSLLLPFFGYGAHYYCLCVSCIVCTSLALGLGRAFKTQRKCMLPQIL